MSAAELAKKSLPFRIFIEDVEDDDSLDQFAEHLTGNPSFDHSKMTYQDYLDEWNRWV